jgi:hypothetical protein
LHPIGGTSSFEPHVAQKHWISLSFPEHTARRLARQPKEIELAIDRNEIGVEFSSLK